MDLSPNDIRNYEFNTQMRGFDKEEVDSFLEQVATTLDDLKQNLLKKTVEMDSLQKQYDDIKGYEDIIKSAAIDARRNADQTMNNAKQEAEQLLAEARVKAENLIHDRAHEFKKIEAQIYNLNDTKKSYLTELKNLIKSHLNMVDEVAEAELEIPEIATSNEEIAISNEEVATSTPDIPEVTIGDLEVTNGDLEVTDSTDITVDKMETIANEMSNNEPEPELSENAQVPYSEIDEVPSETNFKEEAETENDKVDPELENALKSYQHDIDNDSNYDTPPKQPMFGPERVVETTAKAEDIPKGFIAGSQNVVSDLNNKNKVENVSANNTPEKKDKKNDNAIEICQ